MEKKRFQKIYIEILNTCNLKCSFCKESNRASKIMNKEDFEKVILKVKNFTNLIALHVKGEPLMHPELEEILNISDRNNVFVNITTNGTLLLEKVDTLSKSSSLRQVNISLHSINKSKSEFLKTQEQYLEDIFKATEILKKQNNPYISYRLWNLKDISKNDENISVLKDLEDKYKIKNLHEEAKKNEFIELDEKVFLNQDIEFKWPDTEGKILRENGTCLGLRNQIAILSNGDVTPCCLDQNADIKLGNIFEESLEEILEKDKCKEIIKGFEENRLVHKLCKTCGFIDKFK